MAKSTVPVSITGPTMVVSRTFDEDDSAATSAAVHLPAYAFVPPFGVQVYTPEAFQGTSVTVDVGDGSSTDGWITTTNCASGTTAAGVFAGTTGYASTGKLYTSEDTIDITLGGTATNGSAYVSVMYYDWSDLVVGS